MDRKLYAHEDNVRAQLNAGISAAALTIPLKAGQGASFPQPLTGTATSAGDSNTLNDTGIQATGIAVGDVIENITDGSYAVVKSISTNAIETTRLKGGSDNTWQINDIWVTNRFVITIIQYNTDGVTILKREKLLIRNRTTDSLTVDTGGRGYDGSTAQSFNPDDYVYIFWTSAAADGVKQGIAQALKDIDACVDDIATLNSTKANDSDVVHDTGNETVDGIKTFSSIPVLPASNPTTDNQAVRKKYVDDSIGSVPLIKSNFFCLEAFAQKEVGFMAETTEEFNTGTDSKALGDDVARQYVSMGFQIPRDWPLGKFAVRVKKINAPTSDLQVHIYSDNAGKPNASLGSYTLKKEWITTSYQWFTCTLNAGIDLTANAQYHIVFTMANHGNDSSNYYQIEGTTAGGYANGGVNDSTSAVTWTTDGTRDLKFKMYYLGMVKADNDDDTRNVGGDLFVAADAINTKSTGAFIFHGRQDGYSFDFYDDPADVTIYDQQNYYSTLVMGDVSNGIYFSFNANSYTLLSYFSLYLRRISAPTTTLYIQVGPYGGSAEWTQTIDTSTLPSSLTWFNFYPNLTLVPGKEYQISVYINAWTGNTNQVGVGYFGNSSTPPYADYTTGNITIFQYGSGQQFAQRNFQPMSTIKLANKLTQYRIGRNLFVGTTAGGYDITGKRTIGKIVERNSIFIGRKIGDSFIREDTLSFYQFGTDQGGSKSWRFPVPSNAEKAVIKFATDTNSSHEVTIYRVGKTVGTFTDFYFNNGNNSISNTVTWDGDRIVFDTKCNGTVKVNWFE